MMIFRALAALCLASPGYASALAAAAQKGAAAAKATLMAPKPVASRLNAEFKK